MLKRTGFLALAAALTLGSSAFFATPSHAQSMRGHSMSNNHMMHNDGMMMRRDNRMMRRCKMMRERVYDRRTHRYVMKMVCVRR